MLVRYLYCLRDNLDFFFIAKDLIVTTARQIFSMDLARKSWTRKVSVFSLTRCIIAVRFMKRALSSSYPTNRGVTPNCNEEEFCWYVGKNTNYLQHQPKELLVCSLQYGPFEIEGIVIFCTGADGNVHIVQFPIEPQLGSNTVELRPRETFLS